MHLHTRLKGLHYQYARRRAALEYAGLVTTLFVQPQKIIGEGKGKSCCASTAARPAESRFGGGWPLALECDDDAINREDLLPLRSYCPGRLLPVTNHFCCWAFDRSAGALFL